MLEVVLGKSVAANAAKYKPMAVDTTEMMIELANPRQMWTVSISRS